MTASAPEDGSLCRDCAAVVPVGRGRCHACGSPRLLDHPELQTLSIAHVDCDAFYASIEKRDDPSLRDRPVIIGGGRRGVVSTACYIARISGVHSAMPMFKALAACPDAVVIKPDMDKYSAVGREVRDIMMSLTPMVEPISIDEAFMDLGGTERLHGSSPATTLIRFANQIEADIGITISVGLSHNKFLAKLASDFNKPRGFSVIGRAETLDVLASLPVGKIWGIGKAFRKKLAQDGIRMISDLQNAEEATLAKRYGAMGLRMARLSRGQDDRRVNPESERKSVSSETTFNRDHSDLRFLTATLRKLSEKVSARLKAADIAGRSITLKLKTAEFKIVTRSRQLPDPTCLADTIFKTGRDLLEPECDGRAFRLIGIGVADLHDRSLADPANLLDPDQERRSKAEHAVDALRDKFGRDAVNLGLVFEKPDAGDT
ncbi:MAG: DNA polymerase IV [Pseudomonadota bacterium]